MPKITLSGTSVKTYCPADGPARSVSVQADLDYEKKFLNAGADQVKFDGVEGSFAGVTQKAETATSLMAAADPKSLAAALTLGKGSDWAAVKLAGNTSKLRNNASKKGDERDAEPEATASFSKQNGFALSFVTKASKKDAELLGCREGEAISISYTTLPGTVDI